MYTYDQRHRVTNGTLKDSGNNNVRTFGYTYDAANNLTAKTRTVTSPASSDSWVYAYDNANEQTSVTLNGGTPETRTYDDWGRMATRTQGSSSATFGYRYGGREYSYATNFAGESGETLQYRGDGRLYSRVSGATTKVYRYDRGWNAIDEEDGAGNLTATSVYPPGSAVGVRLAYMFGALSNGAAAYAYHDQLGSTRVWRWWNKGLVGKDDFGPFGEPYVKTTTTPIDYALHVQDPYTGCFHAAYREYAAGWARWTTRDPLGMVDGPNMFAYVGGNSTRRTDSMGLQFWPSEFDPNPNSYTENCCVKNALDAADYWTKQYGCNEHPKPGKQYIPDTNERNFMRHCGASCELSAKNGAGCATAAGLANEVAEIFDGFFGDMLNNGIGISLGGSLNSGGARGACEQACRTMYDLGNYTPLPAK